MHVPTEINDQTLQLEDQMFENSRIEGAFAGGLPVTNNDEEYLETEQNIPYYMLGNQANRLNYSGLNMSNSQPYNNQASTMITNSRFYPQQSTSINNNGNRAAANNIPNSQS